MQQGPSPLDAQLQELQRRYPLPNSGQLVEVFSEQTRICGLDLGMVGLVAQSGDGPPVPGSAAQRGAMPVERAYYELLERFSLLQAKQRAEKTDAAMSFICRDELGREVGSVEAAQVFPPDPAPGMRYALSNGAALHSTWGAARAAAHAELVERDAIVRSWWGACMPQHVPHTATLGELADTYEVMVAEVPTELASHTSELRVAFCIGFPKYAGAPLIRGLSAKPDVASAAHAAIAEALQSLCFLWGEELPNGTPEASPTPAYHQDYYLVPDQHELLRAWLGGRLPHALRQPAAFDPSSVRYVDLTPAELVGKLHVCKAVCTTAVQLTFGPQLELCGEPLPPELRVHPIP